jgi:hypothetical protein
VTLSDGLVILRCWSRDDAQLMAEAGADQAIRRYNGSHDRLGRPTPALSTADADARIDKFALNWRVFCDWDTFWRCVRHPGREVWRTGRLLWGR